MSSYNTLMNGSDTVPALGDASGDKFLIIGFGHNDEKTEPARYTNPNGDYKTEGSFANSLYVNYIQPALERGVIPVVCTPIARLTNENTKPATTVLPATRPRPSPLATPSMRAAITHRHP